jgi:hypothetical protein
MRVPVRWRPHPTGLWADAHLFLSEGQQDRPSGLGLELPQFQERNPQRLDLAEHAMQGGLVRQRPTQRGDRLSVIETMLEAQAKPVAVALGDVTLNTNFVEDGLSVGHQDHLTQPRGSLDGVSPSKWTAGLQQPEFSGATDRLESAANTELAQEVADVPAHRVGRKLEDFADFFVGMPSTQQAQDGAFPFGERLEPSGFGPTGFGPVGFGPRFRNDCGRGQRFWGGWAGKACRECPQQVVQVGILLRGLLAELLQQPVQGWPFIDEHPTKALRFGQLERLGQHRERLLRLTQCVVAQRLQELSANQVCDPPLGSSSGKASLALPCTSSKRDSTT